MDNYNTRLTLLQKLQNQYDSHAWEEFSNLYRSFIFAVLQKMNVDIQDAENICQKVMVQVWKKLPEFEYDKQKGRFRSWLAVITRNQAKTEMRDKYRHFDNPSSDRHQELSDLLDSWSEPEIEKIAEVEWQKYIVKMALNNVKKSLSQNVLDAFNMLNEGKSIEETARTLDLEENTVYRYRTRVEKQITQEVRRLENELG